ncbi:MAG: low-specificity L-threonine aldolase [Acidimicrobiales bacterium]
MIDLRSDTVTRPTAAMRRAMADAEVGDDVFGDDPTVLRLEATVAERLGKDAAVFVTSGTQSNLCALMAHCGRGDEYVVGDMAHMYRWEGGGGAVLGSVQPQPVPMLADGLPDPVEIAKAIKPIDDHFARSRLLCLENTKDGTAQSVGRMAEAIDVGRAAGLAVHLDGARMWNAAVDLGVAGADLAAPFDSVSMCLSKGLGAPAGSVLSGSRDLIREARHWRKMLGGGLRQAGVLAAAGLHALDHHVERLADDHARAAVLATGLADLPGVTVTARNTNMVFIRVGDAPADLAARVADQGIRCLLSPVPGTGDAEMTCRLVTHLDIDDHGVTTAIAAFAAALS